MIFIIFGRVTQFFLALAMMRVATTYLSPEEFGKVSLVLTTTAFFAFFFISPIGMFINRRLHYWCANGVAHQYLLYYVCYLILVSLMAAAFLYILIANEFLNIGMSVIWLIALVCGSIFFGTITLTAIPSLNLLGETQKFVILSVAMVGSGFVCAVLYVYWTNPLAHYWLAGQLVGQTFVGAIGVKILYMHLQNLKGIRGAGVIRIKKLKSLSSFAWPIALAAGLGWVQSQGYKYFMESQIGLIQLGLFIAGYGISAGLISGFESVLTTYYQPRLYRDVNSGGTFEKVLAWQKYASAIIPSIMLTVAFIMILAPELTRLFLGEKFQAAAEYLLWGALAEATRVLIGVYSLIAHVFMRTSLLIIPNIIGAILSIVFCSLLIPYYGAIGAGISLVSSGFAVVLAMHILLAKDVSGGFSMRSAFETVIYAAALWVGAIVIRQLLLGVWQWEYIIQIVLIGIPYLGMQYLILKSKLTDENVVIK